MKDAGDQNPAPLMAAWNTDSQVHLIIGSNSLAGARCAKSIEVGAKPIIIAPETADMHFTLSQHIANGSAQWVNREFQDTDLRVLGREEVDHVVDLVFVTVGASNPLSMYLGSQQLKTSILTPYRCARLKTLQAIENPCQCVRCPRPLLVHTSLHIQ